MPHLLGTNLEALSSILVDLVHRLGDLANKDSALFLMAMEEKRFEHYRFKIASPPQPLFMVRCEQRDKLGPKLGVIQDAGAEDLSHGANIGRESHIKI